MEPVLRRLALILVLAVASLRCNNPSTPDGPRCGPSICSFGQECCNASCGTCVPPGGACSLAFCGLSPCTVDADCRTFSFPCVECACWAIRVDDPQPECPSPDASCLVDPCLNHTARCDAVTHRCALR